MEDLMHLACSSVLCGGGTNQELAHHCLYECKGDIMVSVSEQSVLMAEQTFPPWIETSQGNPEHLYFKRLDFCSNLKHHAHRNTFSLKVKYWAAVDGKFKVISEGMASCGERTWLMCGFSLCSALKLLRSEMQASCLERLIHLIDNSSIRQ